MRAYRGGMTPTPAALDAKVDAVLAHVLDVTPTTGALALVHVRALELQAWRLGVVHGREPSVAAVAPAADVVVVN